MTFLIAMLAALAVDAAFGWPEALYRRIGHPVTWLGRLIAACDRSWNREGAPPALRRAAGILAALFVIGLTVVLAALVQAALPKGWIGSLIVGLLAWPLVAARSLQTHVRAVATPLLAGDLGGARQAVAMIVGRDPNQLDAPAVARAGIESLAENASDGIVAPLFWGALFGLPGIAGYKAINTLDSMIGHRSPRHEAFGWASARIDDVVNLIPARLTALLFLLCAGHWRATAGVILRDAPLHRSPNAGWPEAAMAGALGIRLSGPRIYGTRIAEEPWVNGTAPDPDGATILRALALYRRALLLLAVFALILASLSLI